ncbi:hypothetical protein [Methanoregula sp.]|jgi:hypothetical protein|uniref:hypothetical protein n=1 Tax=Methanoregula sp. TaxID=2052170 RepID=UPI0025F8CEFE|nr:hypothetical protein [Methanoregula sp.]
MKIVGAGCGTGTIDFTALLPLLPASASRIIECSDPVAYEKSVAFLSSVEERACQTKVPVRRQTHDKLYP